MDIALKALLLLLAFMPAPAGNEPPYASSVVGTDFDFILTTDPDTFVRLEDKGQGPAQMPDKSDRSAPLVQQAFLFTAHFNDGTRVTLAIDADFETQDDARKEALRYTPRLGKLPTSLRRGVDRVVIHKGGENVTAFSDVGLIVLYAGNATKRIGTHDLEETVFHESVHAAWDKAHAASAEWLDAQHKDVGFVTNYARENPTGEDLAESALFAYALIHHPKRIPRKDAAKITRAIPNRIAFVEKLLPKGVPLHFAVEAERDEDRPVGCEVDLANPRMLSDIISNALMLGLDRKEAEVNAFLVGASGKHAKSDDLVKATCNQFGIEEAVLRAEVEKYRHCNCRHSQGDR